MLGLGILEEIVERRTWELECVGDRSLDVGIEGYPDRGWVALGFGWRLCFEGAASFEIESDGLLLKLLEGGRREVRHPSDVGEASEGAR